MANTLQYAFPSRGSSHILSLLPTDPPSEHLAIGTTTSLPPTPDSFSENPRFLNILQSVIAKHAIEDPEVQAQAQVFVSTAGSQLGTGGAIFNQRRSGRAQSFGGDGAGGANSQGGVGGGGRGGFVHISDTRCPPDYGRIAWPEDIFGSLQVNANGELDGVDGGYQPSGTYRILTREGM